MAFNLWFRNVFVVNGNHMGVKIINKQVLGCFFLKKQKYWCDFLELMEIINGKIIHFVGTENFECFFYVLKSVKYDI